MNLTLKDFSYTLPQKLIAATPTVPRDAAKLMTLDKNTGKIGHYRFRDLARILTANDVLVLNQTKVFPARLLGNKASGGKVEVLLLEPKSANKWWALSKPGLKRQSEIIFGDGVTGTVTEKRSTGEVELEFNIKPPLFKTFLDHRGLTPLPPYITSSASEKVRRAEYQTVYATTTGSAAAPTAGMHFTKNLLNKLKNKGVTIEMITLHVGLGTFQRLRQQQVAENKLHRENFEITAETAKNLAKARAMGKRIIAVGTTTVRALESATTPGWHQTSAFFYPPYRFKRVDGLITNFHLPESSLLMMVAAFGSEPNTQHQFISFKTSVLGKAYRAAIKNNYRFFSFGDAMLII